MYNMLQINMIFICIFGKYYVLTFADISVIMIKSSDERHKNKYQHGEVA